MPRMRFESSMVRNSRARPYALRFPKTVKSDHHLAATAMIVTVAGTTAADAAAVEDMVVGHRDGHQSRAAAAVAAPGAASVRGAAAEHLHPVDITQNRPSLAVPDAAEGRAVGTAADGPTLMLWRSPGSGHQRAFRIRHSKLPAITWLAVTTFGSACHACCYVQRSA